MRKSCAASVFLLLALGGFCASPAPAASSAWAEGEGVSVRLVTAGAPDARGSLRGFLDLLLKPGWKTYWRDPGAAGVPPSVDVSASPGIAGVRIDFPVPERHDDGYGAWAGYAVPVALPLTFTLADPAKPGPIEADIFLGVCRDICVPFSVHLSLDPANGDEPDDVAAVSAAFAALPRPADAVFGLAKPRIKGDTLLLDAALPQPTDAAPELFIAGENGWIFGVPEARPNGAGWRFAVPILDRPAPGGKATDIFYTLNAATGAASGTVPLP